MLEILGFDFENNTFNSLEGIKFKWTLIQNEKIAQIISFKVDIIKEIYNKTIIN